MALLVWNLSKWPEVQVGLGPIEIGLLLLTLLLIVDVQGLPTRLVRYLLSGFRSREWDFDRRLFDEKQQLDRLLLEYRGSTDWTVYGRWRSRVLRKGRATTRTLRKLQPPTPDWAAVRDGYVHLYDDILDRIERHEHPDDADTLHRGTEVKERADVLRIAYRVAARRSTWPTEREASTPTPRRRVSGNFWPPELTKPPQRLQPSRAVRIVRGFPSRPPLGPRGDDARAAPIAVGPRRGRLRRPGTTRSGNTVASTPRRLRRWPDGALIRS